MPEKKTLQICSTVASGNFPRQLNLEKHTEEKNKNKKDLVTDVQIPQSASL